MSKFDDVIQIVIDVPVVCVGEAVDDEELEQIVRSHLSKAICSVMESLFGRFKARASAQVNLFGCIKAGSVNIVAVRRGSYDDTVLTSELLPRPKTELPVMLDWRLFCDDEGEQL